MRIQDYANMNDWWKRLDDAIARQVNLGLAIRKGTKMACEGSYQGEPLCVEPGEGVSLPSNLIQVPEGCGHYYDETGFGYWISWPTGDEPPPADHQAPGAHPTSNMVWGEPKVVFNSSGVCTSAGYAPGNIWYNVGDQSGSPSNPNGGPNKTAALVALMTLSNYLTKSK